MSTYKEIVYNFAAPVGCTCAVPVLQHHQITLPEISAPLMVADGNKFCKTQLRVSP
jgi:hypothetical protein